MKPLIAWMAIFVLVLVWGLGTLNVTIMEARNFVTAREMITDGSYLIPTLNGEYRLQKPPLPTWMTAAMMKLTGSMSLFWLRLPAVLLGLLAVFFSMKIVAFKSRKSIDAIITGMILTTSFYFFWTARSGMWDIFAQGFTVMAAYFYMRLMAAQKNNYKIGLVLGLCLAASFMSKGPVALYGLFLPFLCAFHVLHRSVTWSPNKIKSLIIGVVVAVLFAAAWPLFIYFSEAANAAVEIAKIESKNWSNYHVKPFYHYWSFPLQSGIWTVFGFLGIVAYIARYRQMKENKAARFYFWWMMLVIFFLSLIPEKKERYLLPVLFPMAMFLAEIIQNNKTRVINTVMRVATWMTGAVLFIAGVLLVFGLRPEVIDIDHRVVGGVVLSILSIAILFFSMKKEQLKAIQLIALTFVAMVLFFLTSASNQINSTDAVNTFTQFQSDPLLIDLPLYSASATRPEVIWYVGREAVVVNETFDQLPNKIGIFSPKKIENVWDAEKMKPWRIVREDVFDQNPKISSKKRNIALRRYFAILEKK